MGRVIGAEPKHSKLVRSAFWNNSTLCHFLERAVQKHLSLRLQVWHSPILAKQILIINRNQSGSFLPHDGFQVQDGGRLVHQYLSTLALLFPLLFPSRYCPSFPVSTPSAFIDCWYWNLCDLLPPHNEFSWGYLQQHGQRVNYKSMGNLPLATPLKKPSLSLLRYPLTVHRSSGMGVASGVPLPWQLLTAYINP